MLQKPVPFSFFTIFFLVSIFPCLPAAKATLLNKHEDQSSSGGSLWKRHQRRSLVVSDYGEVSAIDVNDGDKGLYHIQFITLEPNSLFLPVLLHADMVIYVHTGSGRLSWTHKDDVREVAIKRGDLFRLNPGTIFFVHSDLHAERQKLRINAIFTTNNDDDIYDPAIGAYSNVRNLLGGFDPKMLQSAFKVSEEVIESITNGTDQSAIVHAVPTKRENFWDLEARFLKAFLGGESGNPFNKNTKTFNIFMEHPDFKNCNGWSLTVDKKTSHLLKGSNIALFMVNLTTGSMMGPHWNPRATEISIVLQGEGMVRVVCSSNALKKSECKNMRFRVREGDVFAVPKFHPMAQLSFNNDSLVFMGFSTTTKRTYPQFLAGKYSVLRTLDKEVLAASFNVTNRTVDLLFAAQADSVIIDCTSCAEEEEKAMLEEIEKEKEQEEARKREEEQARKREEEDARRREEEAERREEEAARKREEEEAARKREEEEEAERKREEEEAARKRQEEEQAARKRQEEEQAARKRQEEEQAARKRQEEEAKQQEEEATAKREREKERERERKRQQQKERERREEDAQREQEEARRQQEERRRRGQQTEEKKEHGDERKREEEGGQGEEETRRQEKEMERKRHQQKEWERREEDAQREQEEARRQQQQRRGRGRQQTKEKKKHEVKGKREEKGRQGEEETRRQEEERERQQQKEWERGEEDAQREQEAARRQSRGRQQPEEQQEWEGRVRGGIDVEEGRR